MLRIKYVLAIPLFLLMVTSTSIVGAVGKTTVDPNAPGSRRELLAEERSDGQDDRLRVKITYSTRRTTIVRVLNVITQITGVTLLAGASSKDWQVRDRKLTIFAHDVSLAAVMNSIARVMKFKWKKCVAEGGTISYRLLMDRKTLLDTESEEGRKEAKYYAALAAKRQTVVNDMLGLENLPSKGLTELRDSNPWQYLLASSGAGQSLATFLREAPDIAFALNSGSPLTVGASHFSAEARDALLDLMQKVWKLNSKLQSQSTYPGLVGKLPLPSNLSELIDGLTVEINNDLAASPYSLVGQPVLGMLKVGYSNSYVDAKDGFDYGARDDISLELMDPTHPVVQRLGKMALSAVEDGLPMMSGWAVPASELPDNDLGEPSPEHSNDPTLENEVTIEKRADGKLPSTVLDILAAMASSAHLSIVSDSFGSEDTRLEIGENMKLGQLLDAVSLVSQSNWSIRDGIVELRNRYWFMKRMLQLPEEMLQCWRRHFLEKGILDVDDMSQIAILTQGQYDVNIKGDPVLDQQDIRAAYVYSKDPLTLYAALSSKQRSALLSGQTVSLMDINLDRQRTIEDIVLRARPQISDSDKRNLEDLVVACDREAIGKQIRYTFHIFKAQDELPTGIAWVFMTPQLPERKPSPVPISGLPVQ